MHQHEQDQQDQQDSEHPSAVVDISGSSHKQLAQHLDLYSFPEWAPGMPFLHDRGLRLHSRLEAWARERLAAGGYEEVRSPQLCRSDLWRRSGHWDGYADKMFRADVDDEQYALKAMSCPAHAMHLIERARHRAVSLPVRIAEMGHVHRLEPSGSVNGLLRARSFVQDDAHVFCSPAQVMEEVLACLQESLHVFARLGMPLVAELSLRPEQRHGSDALWDRAEADLRAALQAAGIDYEERPGEGAFYGPKVDLHAFDRLGRAWQMGSCQLDYVQPERFDLAGALGVPEVVMVHRAHFGSFERLIGVLLEHFDGRLPVWLAPDAVRVLPVSVEQVVYAQAVADRLGACGVGVSVRAEDSLGKRIRRAHDDRVAVCLVVGVKEVEAGSVAVRVGGQQAVLSVEQFQQRLVDVVEQRHSDASELLLG